MDQKAKYVKTNWVDKETIITANNMNKLENQVDILTDSLELANASLAEIETKKIDKNGIVTMANMGQDVKEALVGGGQNVAVVGREMILNENIVDGQIDGVKTDFLTIKHEYINLFNKNDIVVGSINSLNGIVSSNDFFRTSDFIKVKPNKQYTLKAQYNKCFYDKDKTYIGGADYQQPKTFTTSSNCEYIRYSFTNGGQDVEMLVEGDTYPTKYIAFYDNIPYKMKTNIEVTSLADGVVEVENCTFVKKTVGKNLYNYNARIIDTNIDISNGKFTVSTTNWCVSDFIPVENGKSYTFALQTNKCFYDVNKKFLYSENYQKPISFTVINNAKYVVLASPNGRIKDMLVEGSIYPNYFIPYNEFISFSKKIDSNNTFNFENSFEGSWYDKKWLCIGDSITENNVNGVWWYDKARDITRADITRCAYVGKRMRDIKEIMTHANVTEDMIKQQDLITVFLGQNDRTMTIGDITDVASFETDSFYANCKATIEYLFSINSLCTYIFVTPTPSGGFETNLKDISSAIINVCKLYSIPVFNLNAECNFNTFNYSTFYNVDKTHLNDKGLVRIGKLIGKSVQKY